MHRKNCMPRYWLWIVLLGGLLLGGAGVGPAAAQEGPIPTVLVPISGTKKLQMSNPKQLIKTVQNADANIVGVSPLNDDPTAVLLTGRMAGTSRVILTDKENRSESFDIVVQLDVEFLRKVLREAAPGAKITPIPISRH